MNEIRCFFAVSFTVSAMIFTGSIGAQSPAQPGAGVTHISGGSSGESRAEMKQQAGQYNTRATFVTKSGAYLSDVDVAVTDSAGKVVLTTRTEGPWLYARLAAGSYQMRATVGDASQTQKFTVPAQGAREITFRWEREQ